MGAAELRRRADQKLAAAGAFAGDANRLRSQASVLTGLLDPLVSISQRVWTGPAAADFEANSRVRSHQVDRQAARMGHIAGEFDDRASVLRREAAALQRAALVAEAVDAASIPGGAGW